MTRLLSLLAVIFSASSLLATSRAESALRGRLTADGVACGFDADRNVLVAIGSAMSEMQDPKTQPAFPTTRETLFRIAGLKARAAILQAVRQTATGLNGVRAIRTDGAALKDAESVFSLFASGSCRGFQPIASEEAFEAGVYAVAVAVRWQPLSSEIAPAADAEREMRAWCAETDLAVAMPTALFRDSAGHAHPLGIAFGDCDEASGGLRTDALTMRVSALARKNLLLAVFGDAVVQKEAIARLSSGVCGVGDAERAFEALAAVSVTENGTPGIVPICERVVVSPISGRRLFAVVCAVTPSRSASARSADASQTKSGGSLLVFNPATGRFERSENSNDAKGAIK